MGPESPPSPQKHPLRPPDIQPCGSDVFSPRNPKNLLSESPPNPLQTRAFPKSPPRAAFTQPPQTPLTHTPGTYPPAYPAPEITCEVLPSEPRVPALLPPTSFRMPQMCPENLPQSLKPMANSPSTFHTPLPKPLLCIPNPSQESTPNVPKIASGCKNFLYKFPPHTLLGELSNTLRTKTL